MTTDSDRGSGAVTGSSVVVPPIRHERRSWMPRNPHIFSRAEVARQTGEYQSAVTAELGAVDLQIDSALAADVDEATVALKDFDHHSLVRLGATSPELGPMSAVLLRTESASSSQIEQLTTSARQLALAEIDEGDKANARAVIGNVRAMEAALRLSARLDDQAILEMHRELVAEQWSMRDEAGRWRRELVWIGGRDSAGPRGAEYIAPQPDAVAPAIADLLSFAARTDLPSLVRTAVAHAQFESIHPFVDGNGRTGRALAHAMIREAGIVRNSTVPLSAGLLVDTDGYFHALEDFRRGNAAPIIRSFTAAARFAAVTGRDLVDALADQIDAGREALHGLRAQAAAWRVLPVLVAQPVINTTFVMRRLDTNDMTASRAIDALVERGVLRERTGMRRHRVWQHDGILGVLDDYAATIRRSARR